MPLKDHNLWVPWVRCIQQSLDPLGRLCLSSFCINSSSSVQVFGGMYDWLIPTFDSTGNMLDEGSLPSNSSQHVGRHSSALSCHKRSHHGCFVGQVLKGLPYLHLSLWLCRYMCCTDKGPLPQSLRQWHGLLKYLQWNSTINVGKNGEVSLLQRVSQIVPYLVLN